MKKGPGVVLLLATLVLGFLVLNGSGAGPDAPSSPHPETVRPGTTPDEDRSEPSPVDSTSAAGTGPGRRVTGTVTDAVSGAPIAGALVRVLSTGETTRTDARGGFAIPVVHGDSETIRVEAEGYPYTSRDPDLTPGHEPPPLLFRLKPGAAVTGIVLDHAGEPVAGATVRESSHPDRHVKTDADGGFRLVGIRGGRGTIVEAERAGLLSAESEVLRLETGEEFAGLILRLRRGARISGRARTWDGGHAVGVRVLAMDEAGTQDSVGATTDNAGRFTLEPLGAGSWRIRSVTDGGGAAETRVPELREGEAREGVELRLGGELAGRVIDAKGAPVRETRVLARPWGGAARTSHPVQTETDDHGAFTFALHWAEAHEIRVFWPDSYVLLPPIRATLGERALEIRLPAPSDISGRVALPDGSTLADFTVVVYRDNAARPETFKGKDGAFLGRGLAPGKATLMAWSIHHWSERVKVTLIPGKECANVLIRLRTFATLIVRVTDASGVEVDRHRVELRDAVSGKRVASGSPGLFGPARMTRLHAGRYTVHVESTRGEAKPVEVTLVDGETHRLTMVLED